MNRRYYFLVLGLLMVLAGSGVAEIGAQPEGNAEWLPIKSWEWDKDMYEVPAIGGSTSFTAHITFKNMRGETATITSLTMATVWTPQPTWTGSISIPAGGTGTVEFKGSIAAGQTGDHTISLTGTVEFDGTEYKITWFKGSTLHAESTMIPGFPVESVAFGLLAAIIVLLLRRGIVLPKFL